MGKTLSKAEQELLDSLPDDAKALISGIQKDHDEEIAELASLLEDSEDDTTGDDTEAEVLKKADPAVLAIIQKSKDEAAEAIKIAKAERELRVDREMLAKAQEYKNIAGSPQEKAELLKSAYGVSEEFARRWSRRGRRLTPNSIPATSSPNSASRPVCWTAGCTGTSLRGRLRNSARQTPRSHRRRRWREFSTKTRSCTTHTSRKVRVAGHEHDSSTSSDAG